MEKNQEGEKMKHVLVAGGFTIISALLGIIYGKSATEIVINNLQGEAVKVSPHKAEREYADLYSKYLDLKSEHNQLNKKLSEYDSEAEISRQAIRQRDQLQSMLDTCESKLLDTSETKNKGSLVVNSSVVGKWKGQVISEGLPVVVSVDIDSLKLGEKTMNITYGSPRNCTSRGEYAGAVGNEELFYLRKPTPRTWCNQFTYFTDATIKFKRTNTGELHYEIRDIKKHKKTIETATILSKQ